MEALFYITTWGALEKELKCCCLLYTAGLGCWRDCTHSWGRPLRDRTQIWRSHTLHKSPPKEHPGTREQNSFLSPAVTLCHPLLSKFSMCLLAKEEYSKIPNPFSQTWLKGLIRSWDAMHWLLAHVSRKPIKGYMPVHVSFCPGQTDCRILLELAMDVYTNCSLCAVHKVSTVTRPPQAAGFCSDS